MPQLFNGAPPAPEPGEQVLDVDLNAMGLRYLLLSGHYRSKLDMSEHALESARKAVQRLLLAATPTKRSPPAEIIETLADDMNTPKALAIMHGYRKAKRGEDLFAALHFLGLLGNTTLPDDWRMLPRSSVMDGDLMGGPDLPTNAARH